MPDGRIVEGVLRLALFRDLFENLDLGDRGTITVFRDDGRVLYSHPRLIDAIDRDLSRSEDFRHFTERDHGSLVSRSPVDGVVRLSTFGRVSGFPIILAIGRTTDDIYAAWWRRTLIGAPFRLILCAFAVASTLLFSREIRRRQAAEGALRVAMDVLSAQATTDGLTGIANRRAFDSRLNSEWRRALRARTSIAVLTMDVDHFKGFNDRYGHPRGDEVPEPRAGGVGADAGRSAAVDPVNVLARHAVGLKVGDRLVRGFPRVEERRQRSALNVVSDEIGHALSFSRHGRVISLRTLPARTHREGTTAPPTLHSEAGLLPMLKPSR